MFQVHLVPCLNDNYAYVIEDQLTKQAWVVDPSEAAPVETVLTRLKLTPTLILNTHHHWDHVGGNLDLKARYGAKILCSRYDQSRIEGCDIAVINDQRLRFGESPVRVIEIPGHTLGHVAYFFENEQFLFSGDTLFSAGCGRLFEGIPAQMFASLQKLAALPDSTQVFCGHEYTEANVGFAVTVDPLNKDLLDYRRSVTERRRQGHPSIPSTIGTEKAVNPFIRAADTARFTTLRALKDVF